ncbi:MAG: hypothetical protein V7L11_05755 [Nostoc sp.]|uniref:hypothetical protein n=1 Tax=Nostoc sp. TaxID=1180 RepID=UPI002FF75EA7
MTKFDENLYNSSLKALTEANVPIEIAVAASKVVAKDEAGLPDFGRTAQDQEDVKKAMRHYWAGQPDTEEGQK